MTTIRPRGRDDVPSDSPPRRREPAHEPDDDGHDGALARLIGRSRLIAIVAVVAVLLAAFSLFLLGAYLAAKNMYFAWHGVATGEVQSTGLTVQFLEIVTVMLKAVFFYLIGVGLFSLFISPLNLTVALGVETLNDLETKVISVVIVIMGVHFLEHFIQWIDPMVTLQHAASLGIVVAALVFFKIFAHREAVDARERRPASVARAKVEMFERAHEEHDMEAEHREAHKHDDGREHDAAREHDGGQFRTVSREGDRRDG